jgi:hypothetical protein
MCDVVSGVEYKTPKTTVGKIFLSKQGDTMILVINYWTIRT